ncbi:MAG TPA: tetratricopeptide repeat protein [Rhodanobacteraceae bacterium]|nr:tetratricopeptide repeat protein [Rhodanobacteraceae bacterium]
MKFSANARTRRILAMLAFAAVLVALLAITWAVYHPGLSGDFLFDDFANLPALGATGPVDNWATFWRYITSGAADPTGRPLTLLTFLIDAHNWPAHPYPFKVTNVILHLINGALLAWVLWRLGRVLLLPPPPSAGRGIEGDAFPPLPPGTAAIHGQELRGARRAGEGPEARDTADCASVVPSPPAPLPKGEGSKGRFFAPDQRGIAIAALSGAGVWLLHPLLVSSTLYIVQREAMLPATFVLIGMIGWMASRKALARGHVKRALAGMALSAWLCTGLAVLSKANGALFPILLLLTEWIVLAPQRRMPTVDTRQWHRRAVTVYLIIPSALVIAYLLYLIPAAIQNAAAVRGWTVGQRLLTEPRVITDYLRLLFIPHAHSSGLFNDAFPVSTGWLHPAATIPCMVLIIALIVAGFALRKKYPAIALALLFYFAAQLMESGWLPLELYFEHRNYLPAMLLFWPIGLALGKPGALRFLRVAAAVVVLAVLAVLTLQRARLWGDGFRQAQVWAAINPDSARAQTNAALYDLSHNRPRLAAARLRLSIPKHPDDIQGPVNLIGAECRLGAVRPQTLTTAEDALTRTRVGAEVAFKWFDEALGSASRHTCSGLDFAALQGTLDAAQRNPHWREQSGRQQDLDHLQGQLDLAEGKPDAALQSFDRALAARPNHGVALEQAAYLGSHGYPKRGLAHLDFFATLQPGPSPGFGMPQIHAWVLHKEGWWPNETAYLRKTLKADAAAKSTSDGSRP